MKTKYKILIGITILGAFILLTKDILSYYLEDFNTNSTLTQPKEEKFIEEIVLETEESQDENNFYVNDSIYEWDEVIVDWIPIGTIQDFKNNQSNSYSINPNISEPVKMKWNQLLDINYRLRHFKDKEVDMFAPVFDENLKALNGKEIIIRGYVIPVDEEGDLIALSANPYSSCFFCGNASPASVMSIYLENKDDHFYLDAYKTFKGQLFLNYDDPNQFYYILKNAKNI